MSPLAVSLLAVKESVGSGGNTSLAIRGSNMTAMPDPREHTEHNAQATPTSVQFLEER